MVRARLLGAVAVAGVMGVSVAGRAAVVTLGAEHEIRVDGQPFLPIMQWAQCPSQIAHQATLGINTFVGNGCAGSATSLEYLDACAANGVWGVLGNGDLSVKNHGSLLGWIFGDEPDLDGNEVEPATLKTQYDALRAQDPNHPAFTTLTAGFYSEGSLPAWMGGSRSRYDDYPKATDVIGFDIYPVYGWCQPSWLYKVGAAQSELIGYAPTNGTYQWIEAAKTSSKWCNLAARLPDDGPYPEEIRNEVFQVLANGATAIGYFTHSWECPGTTYKQFCLSAAQESELARTNAQLTALARPILSPRYTGAVTTSVSGGGRLDTIARSYDGAIYLIAVSIERAAKTATFTVGGVPSGTTVTVYDEGRTLTTAGESFTDAFAALAVHIYVIDSGSPSADGGAPGGDPGPSGDGLQSGDAGPTDGRAEASGLASLCGCRSASDGAWLGVFVLSRGIRRRSGSRGQPAAAARSG
ncbi:MAG: hypothetical protein HY903_13375 [Deltaproteobacteria bacterium]|nr:hypothetical protein [Deltaproteobacteria bacterium]